MRRIRNWVPFMLLAGLGGAVLLAAILSEAGAVPQRITASTVILEPRGPQPRMFVPPADFGNLGSALERTKARQEVALRKYQAVYRSYLRWRREKMIVSGPEAQFILQPVRVRCHALNIITPKNWCWYATAARWTERELLETREALRRNEGWEVWGRIDSYLSRAGSPLAGQGRLLYEHGKRANVHPAFIVAVSEFESSLGIHGCGSNRKNIWGLAACDGRWHVPYFETWDEAIGFFTSFVNRTWPSARTPYDFHGYCEGGCNWAGYVTSYMARLGFGPGIRMT